MIIDLLSIVHFFNVHNYYSRQILLDTKGVDVTQTSSLIFILLY